MLYADQHMCFISVCTSTSVPSRGPFDKEQLAQLSCHADEERIGHQAAPQRTAQRLSGRDDRVRDACALHVNVLLRAAGHAFLKREPRK